jgi:dTMP kinase
VFISLEGIDGSGKSTQAKMLAEELGEGTVSVREPGGTAAGERIRELLKQPHLELDPLAELLLFCAARAELVTEVIRPALEEERDVVCDRFSDSSVAYQGIARRLGAAPVEQLCGIATNGLWPDLTVVLQLDPAKAAERISGRTADRFEGEGLELQRRVAAGYEEVARRHPQRVRVVDASGPAGEVHATVMAELNAQRGRVGA